MRATQRTGSTCPIRAAVLLTLSGALGAWLLASAVDVTTALDGAPPGSHDLADAISALCLWGGSLMAAWYALTCVGVLLMQAFGARGRPGAAIERLVRRYGFPWARRILLTTATAGAGVSFALTSATAAPEPADLVPPDLGWGAANEAPSGPRVTDDHAADGDETTDEPTEQDVPADEATRAPEHTAPDDAEPAEPDDAPAEPDRAVNDTDPGTYRVQPGDSLWSIAAAHLAPGADVADIAAAWPSWYRANLSTVGADPDVIRPDLVLNVPIKEES